MYYPYNSRDPLYKSKFGAVASGESLRLRLLLHMDAHVHEAFLNLRKDGEDTVYIKLTPTEWKENYQVYEVERSFEEGLYFYRFSYTSDYGEFFVTAFST